MLLEKIGYQLKKCIRILTLRTRLFFNGGTNVISNNETRAKLEKMTSKEFVEKVGQQP